MQHEIYGGRDPRDLPAYTVPEAAHHLRVPRATLRLWIAGSGERQTQSGPTRSPAVIQAVQRRPWALSFWNLIEAQVLATLRRKHEVPMQRVRKALNHLTKELAVERPLITVQFETDGVDIFMPYYSKLVKLSGNELEEVTADVRDTLKRVERDVGGLAARFYPYSENPHEERVVKIDPETAFGRPIVMGTGVPTETLSDRRQGGDSIALLADEYGLTEKLIEKAIAWERGQAAVA